MLVIKKDGTTEEFDKIKILNAIKKSSNRIGAEISDND
ncbi:MAG: ATP cone domain-containing protein, partial [Cetobacterium sp.]